MPRYILKINHGDHAVDVPASARLLDVLRDELGLFGAKYGCGEGRCGACAVLVGGQAMPACVVQVAELGAQEVTTIEGLAEGDVLTPVQQAFVAETAMQCGYCTSGMLIAATALLARSPHPTDEEIRGALDAHLCRCGVYGRIVRAIHRAAGDAP